MEGAAEEDDGGGVDDDAGAGVGVGLADRASCNACRDFSSLAITALWSVWMQFNLQHGVGGGDRRERDVCTVSPFCVAALSENEGPFQNVS